MLVDCQISWWFEVLWNGSSGWLLPLRCQPPRDAAWMAYLMPKDQNLSLCAALTKISRKRGTSCDSEPPAGANQLVVNLWMSLMSLLLFHIWSIIGSLGSSKTELKLSYPLVAIGQFEPGSKISKAKRNPEESRGIHDVARQLCAILGIAASIWGPPPTLLVAEKSKMCWWLWGLPIGHIHGIFGHLRASPKSRDFQTFPNFDRHHSMQYHAISCNERNVFNRI